MSRYAEGTSVSVERTRLEIERTLSRYGASAFAYAWQGNRASIQFEASGRRIRFLLPLPDPANLQRTPTGIQRSEDSVRSAVEQASRQSWRALLLIVKAKLEAVTAGIVTFEDEFMAHVVLPDGRTVGEHMKPQIALAYQSGNMPKMLPDFSGRPN